MTVDLPEEPYNLSYHFCLFSLIEETWPGDSVSFISVGSFFFLMGKEFTLDYEYFKPTESS